MRRLVVLGLALLATSATAVGAGTIAEAGHRAPAFVVERPDGGEMSSKQFAGRPYLINVFAAWCATCHVEEPLLVHAYEKYGTRVAFLGIDEQEGVARATAYAKDLHVPFPIALDDGQLAATFDTSKIPETVLVDARGYVRAVYRGFVSARVLDRSLAAIAR